MSKLISLLSVLVLCGWMVGCAPEETAVGPDPTTEMDGHEEYMENEEGEGAEHADHDHADDAPPAEDDAPEGGSVE